LRNARRLTTRFEQELADGIKAATARAATNGSGDNDERIEELEGELSEARRQIKLLRSITRLNPSGVMTTLRPFLDELTEQSQRHSARFASPAIIDDAIKIQRYLEDWANITDGRELAERCRKLLKALVKLGRLTRVWGSERIAEVAKLTAQLQNQIDQWIRVVT
jgi:hypothetical protein